jgi:beta-xylosidase
MPAMPGWAKSGYTWAPEVIQIGEQFVLYFTARDKESNKQCVGAAVSSRPDGGFKDKSDKPLVCQAKEGGTIDASPFRDGDKLYLFYKNDGNCCGIPTYIYVQELAPDGLSLVGEAVRLIRNEFPWEGHVIEAPTMFKHNDHYYLFFSANDYGGVDYAVGYATCESVTGPCTQAPENPILASAMKEKPFVIGPGHQHVLQVGDQTWIFYHVWEMLPSGLRGDSRQVWLDRIEWKDDKPVVLGPTKVMQAKPEP